MKVGSMSTIDAGIDALRADAAAADAEEMPLPRFETPIVPKGTVAGRALIAVIAIMTFLASMTIGAVVLLRNAAGDWQADLAREVTIQVRPAAGRDVEADVGKAAIIAHSIAGIADVRPYSPEESAQLLQPWLGGLPLNELPVPRLIAVSIASGAPPDLDQLRRALAEQVPSATLDDHREFVDHMRLMSRTVLATASAVLFLVMIATVLSVTFATRGAMAASRQVIEVLAFIGAQNSFIAGHFQRHFLLLGLKGGAIGGAFAVALFGLADFGDRLLVGRAGGEQLSALFGSFSIGFAGYILVLAQIVATALLTAAAARHTVNKVLAAVQ
jgi:cell division transport system permease protein